MTPAGRPRLVAILGATAAGKSALGIALGRHFGGEVVACDSTAVFRGIDIGTDKVPPAEQQGVPHHLISAEDDVAKIRPAIEDAYAGSHPVASLIGRRPSLS